MTQGPEVMERHLRSRDEYVTVPVRPNGFGHPRPVLTGLELRLTDVVLTPPVPEDARWMTVTIRRGEPI